MPWHSSGWLTVIKRDVLEEEELEPEVSDVGGNCQASQNPASLWERLVRGASLEGFGCLDMEEEGWRRNENGQARNEIYRRVLKTNILFVWLHITRSNLCVFWTWSSSAHSTRSYQTCCRSENWTSFSNKLFTDIPVKIVFACTCMIIGACEWCLGLPCLFMLVVLVNSTMGRSY